MYERSHACHLSESRCVADGEAARRRSISVCNGGKLRASTQFPPDSVPPATSITSLPSFRVTRRTNQKREEPTRTGVLQNSAVKHGEYN
jgi:hypothetical protein